MEEKKYNYKSLLKKTASLVKRSFEICVIGISTGGPDTLEILFKHLPTNLKRSIVIVQHICEGFGINLVNRLNRNSNLSVVSAEEGAFLEPGKIFIAKANNKHLIIKKGQLLYTNAPPENSCRPSVNVLFRSVAKEYKKKALGIIMTGMGSDGLEGCKAIKEVGGYIIVQSKKTCKIPSMPKHPIKAGLVSEILSPVEIAHRLKELLGIIK